MTREYHASCTCDPVVTVSSPPLITAERTDGRRCLVCSRVAMAGASPVFDRRSCSMDLNYTPGAILTPLYQSTTFVQESIDQYLAKGYSYSRTTNPTVNALESKVVLRFSRDGMIRTQKRHDDSSPPLSHKYALSIPERAAGVPSLPSPPRDRRARGRRRRRLLLDRHGRDLLGHVLLPQDGRPRDRHRLLVRAAARSARARDCPPPARSLAAGVTSVL